MSRVHKIGTVFRVVFPIFNSSNALVTGRAGSVTANLLKDGAADATVVTIAEDGTSGIYSATFTPASTGHWFLMLRDLTHAPRGFAWEILVTAYGTLGELIVDANGRVEVGFIAGGVITASSIAANAIQASKITDGSITAAKIATDAITAAKIATDAVAEIADALLDRAAAIDGYTPREVGKLVGAVLCGKASGGPAGSIFRAMNDTADRVATTADADGDRTAVALTP